MRDSIGIRVTGIDGVIYLSDFLQAGNDLKEFLIEVDTALSSDFKPTIDWRIKRLSYSSPAELVAEPIVKEDRPDNRANVINTTLSGMSSLRTSSKRPQGFSDKALETARDLAKFMHNGIQMIELLSDGMSIEYTSTVADNVDIILKPGLNIYGSVEGRLERMNSHGEFYFHIFEPILIRRIKCELMNPKDMALKAKVINLYEHDVIVSGLLSTNINGEVNSAKIDNITGKEVAPLLKDATEVTAIWDFTGSIDPVEHIRRIRDG